MLSKRLFAVTAIAVFALIPASARADWLLTPFFGGNAGGSTVQTQTNFGVSAAWMGAGIVGAEFDAGWAPNFFETNPTTVFIDNSNLSTYMVNAIVGVPAGGQTGRGFRPYGVVGLGALQASVTSNTLGFVDRSYTALGWNVGGGAMGFFGNHIGVRGDVRHFQLAQSSLTNVPLLGDAGHFSFWRVTGGVVLRWE